MILQLLLEIKHIKKFEYNHKYKFRVRSVNSTHENLKESRMNNLKKEEESNKEYEVKLDSIINDLKNEGILGENSRYFNRFLDELRNKGSLYDGIYLDELNSSIRIESTSSIIQ